MRHRQVAVAITAVVAVSSCVTVFVGVPILLKNVLGIGLLAAPGYIWAEILLNYHVDWLQRAAVAVGLALALPVLGGLALHAAGVALHRSAWIGLLAALVLTGDTILLARRRAVRPVPQARRPEAPRVSVHRALALGIAAAVAIGALGLARAGAVGQQYHGFTQLWLTTRAPKASTVSLGVSNHEGKTVRYRLQVLKARHLVATWNLTLANGGTWRRTISSVGNQVVSVNLYKPPGSTHPYRHVATGNYGASGP